jgi:uncharacterized protein YkwD
MKRTTPLGLRGIRPGAYRIALLLALVGCGGGDAGEASAAAASPGAAGAATCGLPNFQATALARINAYRAAGASCRSGGSFTPTTALRWNAALSQAAHAHSLDMQAGNFFSHTGSGGSTLAQRINATGYVWSTIAENIAAGQATIHGVVDGWMASDGHCANLMNSNLLDMGLVCVAGTAGNAFTTYWTLDLGRPR